jgi:hypothetical protein
MVSSIVTSIPLTLFIGVEMFFIIVIELVNYRHPIYSLKC